jgi:hypothetical protein
MTARRYQELEVWQLCEEIRQRVLAETAQKLPSWDRSFCDQIRDAAEDVGTPHQADDPRAPP